MELKPLLSIHSKSKCNLCDIPFIIETPCGADYTSCPTCAWDPGAGTPNARYHNHYKDDPLYDNPLYEDCLFCFKCKIIFQMGCSHAVKGCTDDIHHTMFYVPKELEIINFSDIQIPVFTSYDDAYAFLKDPETIGKYRWLCTCKLQGLQQICSRAYYPKDKFPQYYHSCK